MFASVMALSGVALAAPATPRCVTGDPAVTTPGDVNKLIHDTFGSPGQAAKDPVVNPTGIPANEIAAIFNDIRKTACPNPS